MTSPTVKLEKEQYYSESDVHASREYASQIRAQVRYLHVAINCKKRRLAPTKSSSANESIRLLLANQRSPTQLERTRKRKLIAATLISNKPL